MSLRYLAKWREAIYLPGDKMIPVSFCFYFRRIFFELWDYVIFLTFFLLRSEALCVYIKIRQDKLPKKSTSYSVFQASEFENSSGK